MYCCALCVVDQNTVSNTVICAPLLLLPSQHYKNFQSKRVWLHLKKHFPRKFLMKLENKAWMRACFLRSPTRVLALLSSPSPTIYAYKMKRDVSSSWLKEEVQIMISWGLVKAGRFRCLHRRPKPPHMWSLTNTESKCFTGRSNFIALIYSLCP